MNESEHAILYNHEYLYSTQLLTGGYYYDYYYSFTSNLYLGMMPTTGTVRSQEVAIMVVQHSRHHYRLDNQRLRLSQQVDVHAYVVLHFLVTLYSRTSEEIWTCEVALRSHSNEVIVVSLANDVDVFAITHVCLIEKGFHLHCITQTL